MLNPEITEIEFNLIRDFVHDKYGIFFPSDKMNLLRMKLTPRLVSLGIKSFMDYYGLIRWGINAKEEIPKMISLLTNNETYFLREFSQLKTMRDYLFDELWKKKTTDGDRELKVVSAGCSTGEEVYSIAMLLFESGKFMSDWKVSITGMDISPRALEIAAGGTYYDRSMRTSEGSYIKRFFNVEEDRFTVKDTIKKNTSFRYGNITDPSSWSSMRNIDVVLCRNVLIYFSDEKYQKTIDNIYNALNPGGYLLLGHSETLNKVSTEFMLKRYPEAMIYSKKDG